jgi:hypothetical protein
MTDPGDEKVSRRYRELAREMPPAHADAAILKAARENRGQTPESARDESRVTGVRPQRWMGPLSIAAVLVLGIGVSLRMQMEEPGVETSAPSSSATEYPMPAEPAPVEEAPKARDQAGARKDAAPAPRPKLAAPGAKPEPQAAAAGSKPQPQAAAAPEPSGGAKELAKRSDAPAPQARRREAEANVLADSPVATQQAPMPAAPPAQIATPAAARAKREGYAADSAMTESRGIAAVADPDPNRELERIARLREAGRHAEADRALEELRRRHPDFRIPDAVWERVKPR